MWVRSRRVQVPGGGVRCGAPREHHRGAGHRLRENHGRRHARAGARPPRARWGGAAPDRGVPRAHRAPRPPGARLVARLSSPRGNVRWMEAVFFMGEAVAFPCLCCSNSR